VPNLANAWGSDEARLGLSGTEELLNVHALFSIALILHATILLFLSKVP
jgi:hypothetical protein